MIVVFRCDAGPHIGFGHLTRCRALADALQQQGAHCVMVGPLSDYATAEDANRFLEWVAFPEWIGPEMDARKVLEVAQRHDSKMLVLDDYRVEESYQLIIRDAGIRWLQFEATRKIPIWGDFVLNANPAVTEEEYASTKRNPHTIFLLGPRFAILRDEFRNLPRRNSSQRVRNILVTFGGGDDRGAVLFTLSTLIPETSENITFTLVSSVHNPRNKENLAWIDQYGRGRISLQISPPNMAELMMQSDLAVMAGGTSTFEAARCGLPMIIIAIADNQLTQAAAWGRLGGAIYLGKLGEVPPQKLSGTAQECISNHTRLENMIEAQIQSVPENSTIHTAALLINTVSPEN